MLVSLAVADLLTAFLFIPTYTAFYWTKVTHDVISYQRLGSVVEGHNNSLAPFPLDVYAGQLSAIASVDHLVIIAVDMFASVAYPLWHHRAVTLRVAKTTIFTVWLSILTSVLLPLSRHFVDAFRKTGMDWFTLMMYITLSFTVLALVFNSVLFYKLRKIKRRYDNHRQTGGLVRHRGTRKEKIRTNDSAATSVLIFSVFVIMWTPFLLINIVGEYVQDAHHKAAFGISRTIALIVLVSNSLADPIIYLKKKRHFKQAYILLLTTRPWRWKHLRLHRLQGTTSCSQDTNNSTNFTSVFLSLKKSNHGFKHINGGIASKTTET